MQRCGSKPDFVRELHESQRKGGRVGRATDCQVVAALALELRCARDQMRPTAPGRERVTSKTKTEVNSREHVHRSAQLDAHSRRANKPCDGATFRSHHFICGFRECPSPYGRGATRGVVGGPGSAIACK